MQFELNFNIEDYVIGNYEGNSAFWISFLLEWLCMFWLALCTYFFNMTIRKGAGICLRFVYFFGYDDIQCMDSVGVSIFSGYTHKFGVFYKKQNILWYIVSVCSGIFYSNNCSVCISDYV